MLTTIYNNYPWSHYIVISDTEMNHIRLNNAETELKSLMRKRDLYEEALASATEEVRLKKEEIKIYKSAVNPKVSDETKEDVETPSES